MCSLFVKAGLESPGEVTSITQCVKFVIFSRLFEWALSFGINLYIVQIQMLVSHVIRHVLSSINKLGGSALKIFPMENIFNQ